MAFKNRLWNPLDLLWLALGCLFLAFVGWKWSMPLAAWAFAPLLIRFFRQQDRWWKTLPALPLIALAGFLNKTGAWDMDLFVEILLCILVPLPLWIALYLDRFLAGRLRGVVQTLAFPAAFTALEFGVGLLPQLGTVTSISGTQFEFTALAQLAAVTGVWGLTFMLGWFASSFNALWEAGFDLRAGRPAAVFSGALLVILLLGSLRLALARPAAPTVRVAGVTVPHARDYWAIIDQGTPRDLARQVADELAAMEDELFALSERAALGGARIIFWSEGNGVIYEEDEAAFTRRAQAFAQQHQVYFAPALLILRYGQTSSDNRLLMIDPSGQVAYSYTKTVSWYATDSDGIIDVIDTPYGRLATTICFDMDYGPFIRQLAGQDVVIMLVPGYDSAGIAPYHTFVSLFRGIEQGFSIVRQVNEGESMAVDYQGNILARQDHFRTAERLMYADVPTRGVRTVYSILGDWFAYANVVLAVGLVVAGVASGRVCAQGRRRRAPRRGP